MYVKLVGLPTDEQEMIYSFDISNENEDEPLTLTSEIKGESDKKKQVFSIVKSDTKLVNGLELQVDRPPPEILITNADNTVFTSFRNITVSKTPKFVQSTGNTYYIVMDLKTLDLDMYLEENIEQLLDETKTLDQLGVLFFNNGGQSSETPISIGDIRVNDNVRIQFSNLEHFMDYLYPNSSSNPPNYKVIIKNDSGNLIEGNINFITSSSLSNQNSILVNITKVKGAISEADYNSLTIAIPDAKRYYIKFSDNIINKLFQGELDDNRTLYYDDGTHKMMMQYEKDNGKFVNLSIEGRPYEKKDKINALITACKAENLWNKKGVFNFVDYYVDTVSKYYTLQFIKALQTDNLKSLKAILGYDGNDSDPHYAIDDLIKKYKKHISELPIQERAEPDEGNNSKRWQNFNTSKKKTGSNERINNNSPSVIEGYFTRLISTLPVETKTSDNKDFVQQVIYRCYDLQILYLIKHVEIMELFKILFYFVDMLFKQVCILLFILALYRRYKFDVQTIGEINIKNIIDNIYGFVALQNQVVGGTPSQSGGSNNSATKKDGEGNENFLDAENGESKKTEATNLSSEQIKTLKTKFNIEKAQEQITAQQEIIIKLLESFGEGTNLIFLENDNNKLKTWIDETKKQLNDKLNKLNSPYAAIEVGALSSLESTENDVLSYISKLTDKEKIKKVLPLLTKLKNAILHLDLSKKIDELLRNTSSLDIKQFGEALYQTLLHSENVGDSYNGFQSIAEHSKNTHDNRKLSLIHI
jgi:hypothetical protein